MECIILAMTEKDLELDVIGFGNDGQIFSSAVGQMPTF